MPFNWIKKSLRSPINLPFWWGFSPYLNSVLFEADPGFKYPDIIESYVELFSNASNARVFLKEISVEQSSFIILISLSYCEEEDMHVTFS